MKSNNAILALGLLTLGFSLPVFAQKPTAIEVALANAQQLAGNDKYLQITQQQQCSDFDPRSGLAATRPDAENIITEPSQIYDNLYYIGGDRTGSWLFTTTEGYFMIDAMYGDSPEKVLIPGMKKLGLDPAKLKYILITHAGPDHVGGAKYFQEHYGTQVVMSQQDWEGILNPKPGSWVLNDAPKEQRPAQEREWVGPPEMDIVGTHEQTITLGDTTLTMLFTPRRENGGGLSFIVPVKDKGKKHMWATYGNAGAPRSTSDKMLHRQSLQQFISYMEKTGVDTITSSHPFVDGSIDRTQELKLRKTGEPNPFVIGQEAAKNYVKILDQCTALKIAREQSSLQNGE